MSDAGLYITRRSGALLHLPLPACVGPDMGGSFAVKMPGIAADVFVVGSPFAEMTQEQVMFSAPGLTEGNQVVRVKLQLRVKVEGFDMMDLHPATFVATGHTARLAESMLLFDPGPLGAAFLPLLPGYVRSPSLKEAVEPSFPGMVGIANATFATYAGELQENESCDEHSYHGQEMHHQPVPKYQGVGLELTGPWHGG